jgi:hypothetical protein
MGIYIGEVGDTQFESCEGRYTEIRKGRVGRKIH